MRNTAENLITRRSERIADIVKAIEDLDQVKRNILLKVADIDISRSIMLSNLAIDEINSSIAFLQHLLRIEEMTAKVEDR